MPTETEVTLSIEKLATDGRGLSRSAEGKVVFVAGALPGERVRARLVTQKKDYGEAELVEVVAPSADRHLRAEPPCPHFKKTPPCGGCDLQHLAQGRQLAQKRDWLLETLRRVGRWNPENLERAMAILKLEGGAPWEYRQRIRLHAHEGVIGFHGRLSNQIVTAEKPPCLVAHKAITAALPSLHEAARRCRFSGEVEITVDARTDHLAITPVPKLRGRNRSPRDEARAAAAFLDHCRAAGVPLHTEPLVHVEHPFVAHFSVHRQGFVQPHREATAAYARAIEGWIHDFLSRNALGDVHASQAPLAWDLYAGSGPFTSLPHFAAKRAGLRMDVVAVEGVPHAAEAIARNVPGKAETVAADVRDFLGQSHERLPRVVISDPPRAGMGAEATRAMAELLAPGKALVILVACSPAAFARDAQVLLEAGFTLAELTLFDMFPQTAHYEVLAAFESPGLG